MNESEPRGGGSLFPHTEWSMVARAGKVSSPDQRQALETLCQNYWQPVFAFICSNGIQESEAKDLTQDFFANMIRREAFALADRERGRFRSFLLVSVRNFISSEKRKALRQKRGGGVTILSLDDESQGHRVEELRQPTPDQEFEKKWAKAVYHRVLDRLGHEMERAGYADRFKAMKPALVENDEGLYADIGKQLGLTMSAVKTAVHRFRKRFRELFRMEIASLVADPRDVEDELAHVVRALS